ncbi:hypothetical protein [Streptodolium elevatio]
MGEKGGFDERHAYDPKASPNSGEALHPLTAGLYIDDKEAREPNGDVFYGYLRFTASDRVTSVTSSGTVEQVARWFGPENKQCSQGVYELEGNAISFAVTSSSGTVLYNGTVGPGALTLRLDSRSLINGHRAHRTYHFAQADFPD